MFVAFDLETDGTRNDCQISQFAGIAYNDDFTPREELQFKVQFDVTKAEPEALAVNHYTADAWLDAVAPLTACVKIGAFLKRHADVRLISKRTGRPYTVARLCGFNCAVFDQPKLYSLFTKCNQFLPASFQTLDILQRALFYFTEHRLEMPENFQLGTLMQHFGLEFDGEAHDALADVKATVAVYRAMIG